MTGGSPTHPADNDRTDPRGPGALAVNILSDIDRWVLRELLGYLRWNKCALFPMEFQV
jgi:hypothetical protein